MELRPLADTGLLSSRLVLGTMTFGSQVDQQSATAMVARSMDAGINHFDTANAYNGGESERMLGRALGSRRNEVLIATKVFNPMGEGPNDRGVEHLGCDKDLVA